MFGNYLFVTGTPGLAIFMGRKPGKNTAARKVGSGLSNAGLAKAWLMTISFAVPVAIIAAL